MSKPKFDRSQFKATRVDALKDQQSAVQEITSSGSSDRAKVLELKRDGSKNKLRIFPKHPGTTSWCYPRTVHFLKVTHTDKDGNVINDDSGNPKVGKKPIFNSRVHGGTAKDIIDEYINFVYKKAYDEIQDDDTRKKYLRPIEGWKNSGQWIPGIKPQTRWIVYGDINTNFGRVELPVTVSNKLNEIAAGQDDEEGVIIVDPFTDVDTGRKVFIEYHKDEKDPSKKYTAAIDINKVSPLTDEQFNQLLEQQPLEEIYVNVYRRRDFMMAMEGLKTFDEESAATLKGFGFDAGYEVFSYDEFLDTAEEISEYYPEDGEEQDDQGETHGGDDFLAMKDSPKAEETKDQDDLPFDADPETDNIQEMDMPGLKAYIKAKGLSIRVLPSYTVDQVRQFIVEEEEMIAEENKDQEQTSPETTQPQQRGSRLGNLKNKVTKDK